MNRQEAIDEGKASLDQAESDALGKAFDRGQENGGGGITEDQVQARIADAVQAAKAEQAGLDAQALADAQKQGADALAALQAKFDDLQAKELLEENVVADAKAKVDAVQASFDAIRQVFASLGLPAPSAPSEN